MANESVNYRISLEDYFSAGIKQADDNAQKFESSVNSVNSTISSLKSAALATFSAMSAFNFASGVVEVGSQFESAEVGLSTLLKSGAAAHGVFETIKADAASTPFDVTSLLTANKLLISAGVESKQAREDVLNLANAIAATGGGNDELSRMSVNLQQIKNTGKATALDIKQFAYAGINIYGLLADATGKTTEEVKDMEVSYELLSEALKKAHEAGGIYEGGLEKMAKTTAVQVSNIGDAWMFFKDDLFKANKEMIDSSLSFTKDFIGGLRESVIWVQENKTGLKAMAGAVAATALAITAYNVVSKSAIANMALQAAGTFALEAVQFGLTATIWESVAAIGAQTLAFAASPVGLLVIGVTALAAAWYESTRASEEYKKSVDTRVKDAVTEEIEKVKQLALTYKGLRSDEAENFAIANERIRLTKELLDNEEKFKTASKVTTKYVSGIIPYTEQANEEEAVKTAQKITKIQAQLATLNRASDKLEIDRLGKTNTTGPTDLGSGLSEPKANKIQNITINVPYALQNMKIVASNIDEALDDIGPKITEFLTSLIVDAAIVATE